MGVDTRGCKKKETPQLEKCGVFLRDLSCGYLFPLSFKLPTPEMV